MEELLPPGALGLEFVVEPDESRLLRVTGELPDEGKAP